MNFSVQHIVDCDSKHVNGRYNVFQQPFYVSHVILILFWFFLYSANGGCDGGNYVTTWNFIKKSGIDSAEDYPYASGPSGTPGFRCEASGNKLETNIVSYKILKQDEELIQKYLVAVGPVSCITSTINFKIFIGKICIIVNCVFNT